MTDDEQQIAQAFVRAFETTSERLSKELEDAFNQMAQLMGRAQKQQFEIMALFGKQAAAMEALAGLVAKVRDGDVERHNDHAAAIEQLLQVQMKIAQNLPTASPHNTGSTLRRSRIASTPWKRRRSVRITTSSHQLRLSTERCEPLESQFIRSRRKAAVRDKLSDRFAHSRRNDTNRSLAAGAGLRPLQAQTTKMRLAVGPLLPTPSDTIKAYTPVFEHLATQLGGEYSLVSTTDWAGMAVAMGSGQVDVAWMGPWGYIIANNKTDCTAIATVKYDEKPTYLAIIGRPDLTVSKFPDDTKGMSMSFADVGSTSGWLIPTYYAKEVWKIDPNTFWNYHEGATHAARPLNRLRRTPAPGGPLPFPDDAGRQVSRPILPFVRLS